jgi:site-specific recombinase XerD
VRRLLCELRGTVWLMTSLMYGAGLRLLECVELRVKDVDLVTREIRVRDGKGRKDRVTVVPSRLVEPLAVCLAEAKRLHAGDLQARGVWVALSDALARKHPTSTGRIRS